MAAKFENALDVRPLDDGTNWVVLEDFYYDTDIVLTPQIWMQRISANGAPTPLVRQIRTDPTDLGIWRVLIPKGFTTDFASIPRIAQSIVGGPADGKYRKIAVVHDGLYRTLGLCTRPQADSVFLEGMKFSGCGWWERTVIYSAVRVGGGAAYKGGL